MGSCWMILAVCLGTSSKAENSTPCLWHTVHIHKWLGILHIGEPQNWNAEPSYWWLEQGSGTQQELQEYWWINWCRTTSLFFKLYNVELIICSTDWLWKVPLIQEFVLRYHFFFWKQSIIFSLICISLFIFNCITLLWLPWNDIYPYLWFPGSNPGFPLWVVRDVFLLK